VKPIKDSKRREEMTQEAVALVKKAMKLFDKAGQDMAALHCQEAVEMVEDGHVSRLEMERVPSNS
jgi:UDP-2,3-diacylglucosamine pyrophosphatase LpxH